MPPIRLPFVFRPHLRAGWRSWQFCHTWFGKCPQIVFLLCLGHIWGLDGDYGWRGGCAGRGPAAAVGGLPPQLLLLCHLHRLRQLLHPQPLHRCHHRQLQHAQEEGRNKEIKFNFKILNFMFNVTFRKPKIFFNQWMKAKLKQLLLFILVLLKALIWIQSIDQYF